MTVPARAMVAAAHPLAAEAGVGVLRAGGNAFDAAVATAAALNVAEPFMSGLAGLGMATCYVAADKCVRTLDFVPGVPRRFDPASCSPRDIEWGARACAVPGNLSGWFALNGALGSLSFGRLLEPAIELARTGIPAARLYLKYTAEGLDKAHAVDEEWRRVYTDDGGAPRRGFVLRQPDLAGTLEDIALHGPGHLYGGALGERIVRHLRARGGWLSMEDLEAVEPSWLEPLNAVYAGLRWHSLAPPAESMQFLLTLALLDESRLREMEPGGAEHIDAMVRAIRTAGECRIRNNRCGADVAHALLAEAAAGGELRERCHAAGFVDGRVEQWGGNIAEAGVPRREHTTSLSAADSHGNMVCITQSLGATYGAGLVVPGTGVCMNNFLNWGDLDPASANFLAPGSRLAMCLAPSIAVRADGEPVLALGTPGSYGILQTQPQVIVQHSTYGLDLQAAVDAPRVRAWNGRRLHLEGRIGDDTVNALRKRGHEAQRIDDFTTRVGGFHGIRRDPENGVLVGAADPRRDGAVAAA